MLQEILGSYTAHFKFKGLGLAQSEEAPVVQELSSHLAEIKPLRVGASGLGLRPSRRPLTRSGNLETSCTEQVEGKRDLPH